VDHYFTDVFQK